MKLFRLLLLPVFALVSASAPGCAHRQAAQPAVPAPLPSPASARPADVRATAEQVRAACIEGRRLVCGKVLKVLPDGLVIESGYTDLLRPPLTESWLVPGTVSATRDASSIELNQPGAPSFGVVFLTDVPKRPKAKVYDYVILTGYPAGQYDYSPVPGVQHTIRKFSAGLDTAVRLQLQAPVGSGP